MGMISMNKISVDEVKEIFKNDHHTVKYTRLTTRGFIDQQFVKDEASGEWREVPQYEIQLLNEARKNKVAKEPNEFKLTSIEKDIEVAEALLAKLKARANDTIDEGDVIV